MSFLDIKLRLKSLEHESKRSRYHENKIKYDHGTCNEFGPLRGKYTEPQLSDFRAEHLVKLQRLQWQRRYIQRTKARYTGLAYGILRGTKYRDIENHTNVGNHPAYYEIYNTLNSFGYKEIGLQEVQTWLAEAERV